MKLEVFDARQDKSDTKKRSTIHATYEVSNQATTVVINADIVTIGITMKILEERFNQYINTLPVDIREKVLRAVDTSLEDATYEQD